MMDQTIKMLRIEKKGHRFNTLERFEIYKLTKKALQFNDKHTEIHNPIFDPLIKNMYLIYKHTFFGNAAISCKNTDLYLPNNFSHLCS
jgi:hypothetical protein